MNKRKRMRRKKKILRVMLITAMTAAAIFLVIVILLLGRSFWNFFKTGELELSKWSFEEVEIVLDAGHGGKDEGAAANGAVEKELTLKIAKKVKILLEEEGYQVAMVREEDTFVDLYERARYANRRSAKAFVSIHCNSSEDSANGIETFYAESKEESQKLAELIHQHLIAQTDARDREVKTENFVVVLETDMPAVLAEVGFLSDSKECALLQTEEYQDKVAEGIAAGISEYMKTQI